MIADVFFARARNGFLLLSNKDCIFEFAVEGELRGRRIREDVIAGQGEGADEAIQKVPLAGHVLLRNLVCELWIGLDETGNIDQDGFGPIGDWLVGVRTRCAGVVLGAVAEEDAGDVESRFGLGEIRCYGDVMLAICDCPGRG